jgi:hypothetical protein
MLTNRIGKYSIAVGLALIIVTTGAIPAAHAAVVYVATISPTLAYTGQNNVYVVQITQGSGSNTLGSATIAIPTGWTVTYLFCYTDRIYSSSGAIWTGSVSSGLIWVQATSSNYELSYGKSVWVVFSASYSTAGIYPWTTTAYDATNWSGTGYSPGAQPQVALNDPPTTTVTSTRTSSVTTTVTSTQTQTQTVTQTETVGGGQIQVTGQAYVVIGAPLGPLRITKPAGTSSAAWIDATAASIILGMIQSPSFTYDVNGTAINQGQDPNSGGGQPQVPAPTMIIMSGGPLVNGPVAYYENDARNGKLENAPVYFYQWQDPDGHTYREFRKSIDNSEILTSKADLSILGNHLDYFLIESFHDANGNQVVMIYGYTGYGTFAGALYFKTKLFPAMGNTLSDGYQIVQWYDSNANGFVDTADSFTVVGIQNWPVPP